VVGVHVTCHDCRDTMTAVMVGVVGVHVTCHDCRDTMTGAAVMNNEQSMMVRLHHSYVAFI
jgi:hypothetical protein